MTIVSRSKQHSKSSDILCSDVILREWKAVNDTETSMHRKHWNRFSLIQTPLQRSLTELSDRPELSRSNVILYLWNGLPMNVPHQLLDLFLSPFAKALETILSNHSFTFSDGLRCCSRRSSMQIYDFNCNHYNGDTSITRQ